MLIYRVEHKDKPHKDMYCSHVSHHLFELKGRYPTPKDDSKFIRNFEAHIGKGWNCDSDISPYRFGFASVDQFKRWVYNDDWRKDLDEYDYVMVAYEAEDYAIGDTQAVFLPETASKHSVMRLTEI